MDFVSYLLTYELWSDKLGGISICNESDAKFLGGKHARMVQYTFSDETFCCVYPS
ncbi:hypothetical protein GCM10010912_60050 [Paenibacillus albidus]|uniref:Uncharacterized protein n=1 Tax=Paenibacillus albidus TaxID=2041023 RepID=A0A917D3M8_9BACL|nr:hypothetical protein GCM10010912_60050 [Paenibacillus albidus]